MPAPIVRLLFIMLVSAACAGPPAAAPLDAEALALELTRPAPARRSPRAEPAQPAVFVPRDVLRELTATVVVRDVRHDVALTEETFRLSRDRLSVTSGGGAEWWLERNPLHRNEISGAQVDPAERLVIEYTPGELRLTGSEDLWDRIATLGGMLAPAAPLAATGCTREAFGLRFDQWRATEDSAPVREMWWCAEAALALSVSARLPDGDIVRELVALEVGVDPAALRHPSERHSGWVCRELSDLDDDVGQRGGHDHGLAADGARR